MAFYLLIFLTFSGKIVADGPFKDNAQCERVFARYSMQYHKELSSGLMGPLNHQCITHGRFKPVPMEPAFFYPPD